MSDKDFNEALGWRIVYLRVLRNMSQIEMAAECNWPTSRQCNYERGQEATTSTLRIIARVLNITLNELISIDDNWKAQVPEIIRLERALRKRKALEREQRKSKKAKASR